MSDDYVTYDDYDRAILQQMQRNAAQPLEELSEAVNLSRNAVWRRLKRLQDSGLLKARVAL
jgi:Lrp/AsnC family transcriptional regulator